MNVALIMAAGMGSRMNSSVPKQFIEINGKPLILHTIDRFMSNALIDMVVLVISKNDENEINKILDKCDFPKEIYTVFGGETRQKSVLNAFRQLEDFISFEDIVLIHDGARPNVSDKIITDNIETVKKHGSAITSYKVVDTIVESKDSIFVDNSLNRDLLYVVQTPQSFIYEDIYRAHVFCEKVEATVTDDSSVASLIGANPILVDGSKFNLKITTEEDIRLFKLYLENKFE